MYLGIEKYPDRVDNFILEKKRTGELRTTSFLYNLHKKNRIAGVRSLDSITFGNQIDRVISTLNNTFNDRWDFHLERDNETRAGFSLHVVIHYPSITISNERDQSHNIKDLYLISEIKTYNGNINSISFSTPLGFRTSLSLAEINSNYIHSHLPTREINFSALFKESRFCIGSGTELHELLVDMWDPNWEFNPVIFEAMLYSFDSLLEWESIEGTPYIYISKILESGSNVIGKKLSYSTIGIYYKDWRSSLSNLEIDFVAQENKFRINDNNKFKTFLLETCLNDVTLTRNLIITEEKLTHYLGINNNSDSLLNFYKETLKLGKPDEKFLPFRNELRPFKIIESEQEEPSIDALDIHPQFKNYAKQQLEQELYEKFVIKSTIERHN